MIEVSSAPVRRDPGTDLAGSTSPLDVSPVIPVVVIDDVADAVPLARAALSVSGPTFHVTWERLPAVLDLLRECSIDLSRELGGAKFAEEAFQEPSPSTIDQLQKLCRAARSGVATA